MSALLTAVRRHEVESTRGVFPPGAVVAEIGGGNGFQASLVSSWGCVVKSFDVAGRRPPAEFFHPVAEYDGVHLPLSDASVDVVFSSNVLEHVRELPALLKDTLRVTKPGGLAIHILPTPSWRFWSILAHYPFLVSTALGIRTGFVDWSNRGDRQMRTRERGVAHLMKRILWPGPHGEFPGALVELFAFRAAHWTRALEVAGFDVQSVSPTRLYYSGYGVLAGVSVGARQRMAHLLGSSTQIIVARKPVHAQEPTLP